MNEERPRNGSGLRAWLKRLSQVLLGEPKDRDQLVSVLRDAQRRNLFDADALAMIESVLQVSEMQVRDIMIPRSQMVVVNREINLDEIYPIAIESGHSRFPVISDSRDEVIGILLAKDLLRYSGEARDDFDVRELLRPAVFIPESKRLNVLLKEFRASRNHIAVVVDEYGGVAGMVTIEDVLEQIVGEITDEHDIEEGVYILKRNETSFMLKALTPIDEFNEYFATDFGDDEFDTIGGVVMHEFGRLPKRGESTTIEQLQFKVVRADNRRIHMLQLTLLPPSAVDSVSDS